jgi:hypothetical protein
MAFDAFRLPVSGLSVQIRHPTGEEDVLLAEAGGDDAALALALAERLASASDDTAIDFRAWSVTDLDAFVLRLRQMLMGDRIRADVTCLAPSCGKPLDISFDIDAYLAHQLAASGRAPRDVTPSDEAGWYVLGLPAVGDGERVEATFRLPSAVDELAVQGRADAAEALARRLVRSGDLTRRVRRRVEAAMEALAPSLCGDLEGVCPECGERTTIRFDPRQFCLQELRDRARFIYEDVDLLAERFHWSESAILSLSNTRRASYCDAARRRA